MYEHNALGYWSGLALCLTKFRSSRARCPATALIVHAFLYAWSLFISPSSDILGFLGTGGKETKNLP